MAGISSFVHRQPKLFAICDQLVDENFRGITNPDKYFRKELKKDSQKKKSIYKRIQLAADESSEDEMPSKLTEIIISKEKKKKSVQEQKKSKPTENASKVDKVPLKRKHREREEEHQEIEHNNELVSDYLREVSKSGRKNKSLLRGPKCKRRSLTPVHEEQDDHFGDNDDCEPPMQHETTIKPVSEFVTTLTSIPTTTINAEPTTWRNNGGGSLTFPIKLIPRDINLTFIYRNFQY